MEKHKFAIFPELNNEDFYKLRNSIEKNGYNPKYPIVMCEMEILDGWHRWLVCYDLDIEPTFTEFYGSVPGMLKFVMKANAKRNMREEQWRVVKETAERIFMMLKRGREARRAEEKAKKLADKTKKIYIVDASIARQ
jgi:hypothetical protein